MIVSQPSKSRPTDRLKASLAGPAATLRIGSVRQMTRGPGGPVRDVMHGQWRIP
jgi:hypothetical protein